jgi:hypoxanthine phosphoribosyltransferase
VEFPPFFPDAMQEDLSKTLIHTTTIFARLDEMATQITDDYQGKDLTVLSIMSGSLMFGADLLRRIPLPLRITCLSVSSYHGGTTSSGHVTFHHTALPDLQGRHVLILDDILDTGLTLQAIREKLQRETSPLSIKICVLLRKSIPQSRNIDADYVGFDIANEFVVGYGLDYQEKYRNLPYIGVLRQEVAALEL